mmetsp:Transcript_103372/g.308815  ORF Transcript_103372/g.308815 Transcript_103372/m.308815 type:complete len:209 (+) Transcript_103372:84-710(+)
MRAGVLQSWHPVLQALGEPAPSNDRGSSRRHRVLYLDRVDAVHGHRNGACLDSAYAAAEAHAAQGAVCIGRRSHHRDHADVPGGHLRHAGVFWWPILPCFPHPGASRALRVPRRELRVQCHRLAGCRLSMVLRRCHPAKQHDQVLHCGKSRRLGRRPDRVLRLVNRLRAAESRRGGHAGHPGAHTLQDGGLDYRRGVCPVLLFCHLHQ